MPIKADDITAAPDDAVKPTAKGEKGAGELPDALLEAVPALGLLMQGAPPATYASADADFPELTVITKHMKELGKAGFGVYGTKDGQNVVMFNGLLVTPEEIAAADEAGQLEQIAAPYDQLRNEFEGTSGEAGGAAPASEANSGVSGPSAAPAAPAGGSQSAPPSQITTARVSNLDVGAPTSGPVPGQGRILNNILKPVV